MPRGRPRSERSSEPRSNEPVQSDTNPLQKFVDLLVGALQEPVQSDTNPLQQFVDLLVGALQEPVQSDTNPLQKFVDLLVGALQGRIINNVNIQPPVTQVTKFIDFKNMRPPGFRGTTDPIEAQAWIDEIEEVFAIANVVEEHKTLFATYMLQGEADFWWEANKNRAGEGVIAWTRFKEVFFENYFPQYMQSRMETRFLELKQGDMTVLQYATKFNELARFAPHQVDTEKRKARRFEHGLNPWLYNRLSVYQIESFRTLLEKAIIAEGGSGALSKYNKDQKKKKVEGENKGEGSSGIGGGFKRKWNNSKDEGEAKKVEACKVCWKNHMGVFLKGKNVCYNCGIEGHIAPNCSNSRKSGFFMCGALDHQARNCTKKGTPGQEEEK